MSFKSIMIAIFVIALGISASNAQTYTVSEGFTHKNLTIFLIRGKDAAKSGNILTLQEAMARDLFAVYETSNVNELEVENLSKEFDVFIQSGDIVKGGKQDRVLAVSVIIPARSGRIRIQAFCVESGRWEKRDAESDGRFSSSNERIVTRDLKVAANESRSQGQVWQEVEKVQDKLSANVSSDVRHEIEDESPTQPRKQEATGRDRRIRQKLPGITAGKTDIIGYAFAINGEINSADVYVSNALFGKLWDRMLRAAATEAVAEYNNRLAFRPIKSDQILEFMQQAEKAKSEERATTKGAKVIIRSDKENSLYEAVDEKSKVTVHRTT
ncbi:MAG: hypothetical protein IPN69_18165 [Acidobacteria bacterium]|nr:hypothetical protein [Acidobacteriota bacterium]